MKKFSLILSLILVFTFQEAFAKSFPDVQKSHRYAVAIDYLSDQGYIKGNPNGNYDPDGTVNRAAALKLILETSGIIASNESKEISFPDVLPDQWFAKYVIHAVKSGIVKGYPDGNFKPDNTVKLVEFIKMLLETNRFRKDKWTGQQFFTDVPADAWFAPYMNYAGKSGLVTPSKDGKIYPERIITRGEAAEILYLMKLVISGKNTQFLIDQSERQMAQIETYIGAKQIGLAKRASELAYDLSQQALKQLPDNNVVLGAAKIAKAYDLLIDAFIAGLEKRNDDAQTLAEQTKIKATEAWEANKETQPIARHIKDRADEILAQL